MPRALIDRRDYSVPKLAELRNKLTTAEKLASTKACVYVTGSFGRLEGCKHSDLDIFIVGLDSQGETKRVRALTNLDEICLKAELIHAVKALQFPPFSGDGEFLKHYTVGELVQSLGTRGDDAENTFTARLLLLLESRPVVGDAVYVQVMDDVLAKYWRDFGDHKEDFLPAFLANDILRLWRTLCVNYEAGTEREPDEKKFKRRLKNYKLRHSRLLTCYSALLYLMTVWREKHTVTPEDVRQMVLLSPTERVENIRDKNLSSQITKTLETLLTRYDVFLQCTNASEEDLLKHIADAAKWSEMSGPAGEFADAMFTAISIIGNGDSFHRTLVV